MRIRKAVAAVVFKGDRFLLVHRAARIVLDDGVSFPAKVGGWNIPRGGMREGEAEEAALKRELSEEICSSNFQIVRKLPFRIFFEFPLEVKEATGFTHQDNSVYLVEFLGAPEEARPDGAENDAVGWFSSEEALGKIEKEESKEAFRKALGFFP